MVLKRNLKLNEVGEAGTALKNIEVTEIYSRSSQGGQAGSEHAGGAAGSYLMFLGDGGHLRWRSFVTGDLCDGDLCDGGPESWCDQLYLRCTHCLM